MPPGSVTNEGGLGADVYGTQGLSDCPLSQWEALDPDAIREELNALQILMNGPRFWLIDSVTAFSEIGETRFFGELQMRLIASIALSPGEISQGPYQERSVVRDTEFVFVAGSEGFTTAAGAGESTSRTATGPDSPSATTAGLRFARLSPARCWIEPATRSSRPRAAPCSGRAAT
ncbi:MAG: hypothetical protein OER77_01725, partial [Myxococcales bacterium]|nr:hypothetical protein [Myxococcales bacterium]